MPLPLPRFSRPSAKITWPLPPTQEALSFDQILVLHYAYALSDNKLMRGVSLIINRYVRVVVRSHQAFATPA